MSVVLRPYQATAIANVKRVLRGGARRVLICAPTGSGKTLTAGAIIASALTKGSRVLFVAHRKELIDQPVEAFVRLGITSVGVIRASDPRRDARQPVQVASIQTLARRARLDPPPNLIIIDECHRAASKSYIEHLYEAYPNAVVLGLSATPCRSDGKPLGGAFDTIVPVATYSELIAQGFISEPLVYGTPVLPDLSTVRTSGGDYNQEDLEDAVNKGALIGNLGAEWQKRASDRRTIVFAVSVAHSRAIVEMFRGLGVEAAHLDGNTAEDERHDIIARLGSGALSVVSNCNVLSEGTDIPSVKCIVLARPTKSLALYMQSAGRGLRPWNDVTPIILDHGDNVDRHGLPHVDRTWSLTKRQAKSAEAPSVKACPRCFAYVPAYARQCPHCAYAFPLVLKPIAKCEPVIVDLALRTLDGDDAKLGYFRQLHKECRARGWQSGTVAHRYFARFNEHPPTQWIAALRSDYRTDGEWKTRVADKRAEKKAREETDAAQ